MSTLHPMLTAGVRREIEQAASRHLGRPWVCGGFTDLNDRASHPCAVLHGHPFSVFAKLSVAAEANAQFTSELDGLALLQRRAQVKTPTPIGPGVVDLERGSLLLFEALAERAPETRSREDWRSIGHALASLHGVHDERFGLEGMDGFFGPIPQDNRPVPSNRWPDFYAERRLAPLLRSAVDSGHLPHAVATEVDRLLRRLPELSGPEHRPTLVHGDAQQHNFVSAPGGAVVVDAAPYFGHPEIDLALLDYFEPVPDDVVEAYREIIPIDPGFGQRRELWRICGYLAVVTVDGTSAFGRRIGARLAEAVAGYL